MLTRPCTNSRGRNFHHIVRTKLALSCCIIHVGPLGNPLNSSERNFANPVQSLNMCRMCGAVGSSATSMLPLLVAID